jgi:hypothetical protein
MAQVRILDLVKGKTARFDRFCDQNLWYVTEDGFEFPVPVEDTKGGVFNREEKAMHMMRWIRKHVKRLES